MERGKPGTQSQLQAMKRWAGKPIGITALYPGDSGATTDEVPVMGMEEQAPVSNNKKQHTRYSRVLVRNKKNHSRKEVVDLGTTETHQKAKGPKCRVL